MSVWVEILHFASNSLASSVTLHVSVWVEMAMTKLTIDLLNRHAPRERVSWNGYVGEVNAREIVTLHVSVWVEILEDARDQKTW